MSDSTSTPARSKEPDSSESTGQMSLTRDDAYHILQNSRRRAVLRLMLSHDDRVRFRLRDLAETVAAWEQETTVEQLRSNERQRVYISLYQTHFPKLDEHGIVDYYQKRGIVEVQPLAQVLVPLLDVEAGLAAEKTISIESTNPESERTESNTPTKRLLSTFGLD